MERKTSSRSTPQAIEFDDDKEETDEEEIESKEMDGVISMKSADEEGNRVKKYIVSYETKLLKSPSQTSLHGKYQCYIRILTLLVLTYIFNKNNCN